MTNINYNKRGNAEVQAIFKRIILIDTSPINDITQEHSWEIMIIKPDKIYPMILRKRM